MSYKITVFPTERSKSGGKVLEFQTFEELAEQFSKCDKGGKLGEGFVRGELEPPIRMDENRAGSNLLILDADMNTTKGNAPDPMDVHTSLEVKGINHFIYTSHSHSAESNKFRVVIPTDKLYRTNLELRSNIAEVLTFLREMGVGIFFVKEMKAWSQIWFTPRRDDPSDDLFQYYFYNEGNSWRLINEQENETEEASPRQEATEGGDYETLDELHENIRTGKEYHESLRTLSFQYVKDGMSKANATAILRSAMEASSDAGSKRWQDRFDELPRLVEGVVDELDSDFKIEGVKRSYNTEKMPIPPGSLGDLYKCAFDFLLYQYPEVAIASAVGVVAGICGRKFNIVQPIPAGLNVFLTVIASTGCGKDRINDFANLCIRGNSEVKGYESFIGPSYFTSPKAIINQFNDARSRLCIVSEAGMMLKVKSGNVEGTTAFVLDALQCSHAHGYTKAHAYSSADDNMPSIRAMAMTIVSESTPEQMYEAYSATGALTSGYLPRQTLLKIGKRQTLMNRDVKADLPDHLRSRLLELLETCSAVQSETDPKAYLMEFDEGLLDDFYDYSHHYNELSAENEDVDSVKQHMATRAAQKAVKLASIATVFNKRADDSKCLIVEKQEWDWAKAFCDYEYNHITSALSGLSGDQGLDNACFSVYTKMIGICDNSIKDKKCQIDIRYRSKKLIPYSKLKISCKNTKNILDINDKSGRMVSGLDKVLSDMLDKKAIKIHDRDPLGGRSPRVIQILDGINEYAKHFGV